jgi:hypothetical protein
MTERCPSCDFSLINSQLYVYLNDAGKVIGCEGCCSSPPRQQMMGDHFMSAKHKMIDSALKKFPHELIRIHKEIDHRDLIGECLEEINDCLMYIHMNDDVEILHVTVYDISFDYDQVTLDGTFVAELPNRRMVTTRWETVIRCCGVKL